MSVLFKNSKCSVLKNDITIAEGTLDDGLHVLQTTDNNPDPIAKRDFPAGDLKLWHARLAHVHTNGIRYMIYNGLFVLVKLASTVRNTEILYPRE